MIKETKQLLRERGRLSLRELAQHFSMAPEALEPVLELLMRKGQVRLASEGCGATCSGCTCASREDMLIYELVETPAAQALLSPTPPVGR